MKNDLILTSTLENILETLKQKKNTSAKALLVKAISMARLYEQELAIHRLGESKQEAIEAMEDEALKPMTTFLTQNHGNVIRPNFNGRKK